ncbi:MAG: hypothetical protein A2041_14615 [Bacteroidetes bacterium GWA2_31_9b]|nr:MAG: hypothetical protein A2041_14615 [Bacteroidetes bacterium GWA2_31_9b]
MKKRYIICVNNSSEEQEKKFIDYIKSEKFGWWHYLKNTWLVIDLNGNSEISEIRDKVKELFDNEYNMVFQLKEDEGTWSGFGPKSEQKNMFKWIKENW